MKSVNISQSIIISDPGIDDTLSLFLFNKLSTSIQKTLITSFGNVPENFTFQNGKEILGFFSNEWNILSGAKNQINGSVERPWPYYFHGPDGLWNTHSPIDISSVKILKKIPEIKNAECISLSPLTDLYLLYKKTSKQIKKITIMGGVFYEEGNETPYAETNIAFDPDAASLFFKEPILCPVFLIPLDVTRKVYMTEKEVLQIPESKQENIWMKKILKQWFIKYSHEREENFNLHDPLAVYLHFFPDQAEWIEKNVKVFVKGKKRGQTVESTGSNKIKIAVNLKNPYVIKKHISKILFDL